MMNKYSDEKKPLLTDLEKKERELIESVNTISFVDTLRENRRRELEKDKVYSEKREKELFRDIFSGTNGIKMLKEDSDLVINKIIDVSKKTNLAHIHLDLYEVSHKYKLFEELSRIDNIRRNDDFLKKNPYFTTAWRKFVGNKLYIFMSSLSDKTGLTIRDAYDSKKYIEGSFLSFDGECYQMYFWW